MILAFTGAGISKASGIPTFEDQKGLREKLSRWYQREHESEYNEAIHTMMNNCSKAKPNDAHIALAEYKIPIITMNIDELHTKAGSDNVIELHGKLPNIVLYGDVAPQYEKAVKVVGKLRKGDIFLIVGTSLFTNISAFLKTSAELHGAEVITINDNAETKVRKCLEENKDKITSYARFMMRKST